MTGLVTLANAQYITHVRQESQHPLRHKADRIRTVTDDFDNVLGAGDTDLQTALNTLDDVITSDTPLTVGVACTPNQLAFDANFLYVCIASNTWRRTQLASWEEAGAYYLKIDGTYYLKIDATHKLRIE